MNLAMGSDRASSLGVYAVAGLAGIAATVAAAAPTELRAWDAIVRGTLVVLVVLAAAKAPRWTVIVMACVAAAAGGVSGAAIAAWAALLLGVASGLLTRRSRLVGAAAAGLAAQALLRLPSFGFFGLQSLVAGAAFALVLAYGYRYGTRTSRRLVRYGISALLVGVVSIGVVGGLAVLNARTDVDRGVAAARRGLDAARAGNTTGVADELRRADDALSSAQSRLSSPAARSLRLIPIAAQHQRAIESATAEGAAVAGQAAIAVENADISNITLRAGTVDLGALQAMAPELRATQQSLEQALVSIEESGSPWLLPFVDDRIDELSGEIGELLPEIELGADAAQWVPEMLGVSGPQTYFVMFGVPAESREFGGFVGSWALVTFDSGSIQLGDSGRIAELLPVANVSTVTPDSAPDWYFEMARPVQFPQNLTGSPDFETVAAVANQVLGSASPEPLAGFIYMDPWAIIDMLELTGPVQTTLQEAPLTTDNAADFFFHGQYEIEVADRTAAFDALADVAGGVLAGLTNRDLPGPEELGRILGPAARAGRLQVVTFNEDHNEFLRSVKLLRDFGRAETTDFVGLVQANAFSNKIDLYLERSLEYDVQVTRGAVEATATARLRSVIPADAPTFALGQEEDEAHNRVLLSLYTPHLLLGVTVNGVPADHRSTQEYGLDRYLVEITLPPTGEEFVVVFDLFGAVTPTEPYSLEIWHQPLVNTDEVSVSYQGPEGSFTFSGPLEENKTLRSEDLAS